MKKLGKAERGRLLEGIKGLIARYSLAFDDRWITINGARVLLDDDGDVKGGAGGKFTGSNIHDVKASRRENEELNQRIRDFVKQAGGIEGARNLLKEVEHRRTAYSGGSLAERRDAQSKVKESEINRGVKDLVSKVGEKEARRRLGIT